MSLQCRLRRPCHEKSVAMKRSLITIALTVGCVAPAMADMALAKTRNCMACHAVEKKLVGPAFKDIAKRYAGQSDVVPQLASKILKGGSGVWGPVPMPANNQVSEAESHKLAEWVLSFK